MIAIHDDYERKKAVDAILSALATPDAFVRAAGISSLIEMLQSPSLFGDEPIVFLDETEKLSKQDQLSLTQWIEQPVSSGYLILGARGKTSFVGAVEKQGVILEMLEEKPWEKEKRLIEQIEERVQRSGKKLSSDAAPLLLERIGPDPSLLDLEIDKLLCFVGDRLNVERSDIFRISGASHSNTLWQVAESIVWERGEGVESSDQFHPLVPLIRYQLQLGLKLASLVETGVPSEQFASHFPKLRQKTLDQRKGPAAHRGSSWFRKALDLLFELELLSRDGSSRTESMLDLFRMRIISL